MEGLNDERIRQMENEMMKFEAEIETHRPLAPPPPPPSFLQPMVAAAGMSRVPMFPNQMTLPGPAQFTQPNQMTAQTTSIPYGSVAPPPPPMFMPSQLQRFTMMHAAPRLPPAPPGMAMGPLPGQGFSNIPAPPGFIPPPPPGLLPGGPGFLNMQQAPPSLPSLHQPIQQTVISSSPKVYEAQPIASQKTPDVGEAKATAATIATSGLDATEQKEPAPMTKTKKRALKKAANLAALAQGLLPGGAGMAPGMPSHSASQNQKEQSGKRKVKKLRQNMRTAGGSVWEDASLADWDPDDYRVFCGDLGNDVTDEVLVRIFGKFPSFQRAKVVRDRRTNKSKGFGFISFKDPADFVKAFKEMDGRYVGSRPIKLRKSTWRSRNLDAVKQKETQKRELLKMLCGR